MNNYPDGMTNLPEGPKFVGYDYKGEELYEGAQVWETDMGYVHYDDLEDFMDEVYGKSRELEN